ncbi:MAG: hypothetical protein HOM11_14210 [Methylococcales bacterium]|jgi:hypothetical protein|nr:hypothetical protein [Methylococcales bacterium]MBT7444393.1 hypothetical protein [Methylococcales bacterium]
MDNAIDAMVQLRADNRELKREIKRQKLVNELNIVMFEDAQQHVQDPAEELAFFTAANDT